MLRRGRIDGMVRCGTSTPMIDATRGVAWMENWNGVRASAPAPVIAKAAAKGARSV